MDDYLDFIDSTAKTFNASKEPEHNLTLDGFSFTMLGGNIPNPVDHFNGARQSVEPKIEGGSSKEDATHVLRLIGST